MNKKILLYLVLGLTVGFSSLAQHSKTNKAPEVAKLFAADTISTGLFERDAALSPDGTTFYFTIRYNRVTTAIVYSENRSGTWSSPKTASFSGTYKDLEPVFHPDGKRLFFVSNRPTSKEDQHKDFNIWYVTRKDNTWGKPVELGAPVNTDKNEFYPSFTKDGSIYFCAAYEDSKGGEDLYYCELKDGKFLPPKNMGDSINSEKGEYNSFIAPDGTFIMYNTHGQGKGYGSGDIYISFKKSDNSWTTPVNMGESINSPYFEYCPALSQDGKYLFFTSQKTSPELNNTPLQYDIMHNYQRKPQNGNGDIYWVDAKKTIAKLRKKVFSTEK